VIFHATVLEVLLCVGLGIYIGFVLGLRLGAVWGYEHGSKERKEDKKVKIWPK